MLKRIFSVVFVFFIVVALITIALTIAQVNNESQRLENDLNYRSSLLADGLRESIEPDFVNKSNEYLQSLVEQYSNRKRIAGIAVVDNTGKLIAASSNLPKEMSQPEKIATNVMDADQADGSFVTFNNQKMYVYAQPLHDTKSVVGALLVVQNASYVDSQLFDIWKTTLFRLFIQILLFALAIIFILRWIVFEPTQRLVESLRLARIKNEGLSPLLSKNPLFRPLLQEVSHMQRSLFQAQMAASEEARASLEKLDSPWTAERLKQFTKDLIKDRTIIAVSNREPYIHTKDGNKIEYYSPASGMVTAIEPVMQACSGTWIAHGSGSADREVVDKNDTVQVPPENPKYTLKRVWLTDSEENGYYYGFSNEGLWALSHLAHTRPIFRKEDWEEYKNVNAKFAQSVLDEIKHLKKPIIFIQDFHFALLPRLIKNQRPDATVGVFWHVPWVSAESFSICPWKKELLDGMLGADLIGFHTQQHCNNFIETVGRELESLIDFEQFTVTRNGHISLVKPFPISIAFSQTEKVEINKEEWEIEKTKLLKDLEVDSQYIGVGVDRLDYTKGILERFKAIEIFLKRYPEYKENFTFIQIAAPSRTKIKKYRDFTEEVEREVERINTEFKTKNWKPIILLERHHTHEEINSYYQLANFCLVTPLHDGMNLVAKEFVAARNDEEGVLILSQFTGASKEFKDALLINPYNGEQTAEAIHTALTMSADEQHKRMKKLRNTVKNNNIYRWSAEFLRMMVSLE